jgi:hypothetical protein
MQAAAQDRAAGRLDDPAPVVAATLLAAFTPPGEVVPAAGGFRLGSSGEPGL